MRNRFVAASAAGLTVLGAGACSSSLPAASHKPDTLSPGTGQVMINRAHIPETHTVSCTSIGSLTTIETGNSDAGTTVLVSNENGLTALSVSVHDLGGFTGSYMKGLQGQAQVTMSDQTFVVRGTAAGFDTDNPSARTTGTFVVKVAC